MTVVIAHSDFFRARPAWPLRNAATTYAVIATGPTSPHEIY